MQKLQENGNNLKERFKIAVLFYSVVERVGVLWCIQWKTCGAAFDTK
jgi:hypothetical protein